MDAVLVAMIPLNKARDMVKAHVRPGLVASVDLVDAMGKVLASPILAKEFFPDGDRGTMDGYVVRAEQAPVVLKVVGEIRAGDVPERALRDGEAFRIFTGGLIPEGGRRVVPQEMVRREGDELHIESFSENPFIRPRGCEARPGDVVLRKGTRIGPAELAILAQVGAVRPEVVKPPVLLHLATGNELVAPECSPGPGQIRDSNSSLLRGLVNAMGLPFENSFRVNDDPEVMCKLIDASAFDLLLISGGASVGDYDFGAEVLVKLGFEIHFNQINLRPGKPLIFATRGPQVAFVIPGNPLSHFVTFHAVIRRAIGILSGMDRGWEWIDLEVVDEGRLKPNPRETLWPAQAFIEGGKLKVRPQMWSSSGDSFAIATTNALILVNADSPSNGFAQTLLLDLP